MLHRSTLALDDARRLLAAARAQAEAMGAAVTIAVVDDGGVPIALERLDGARLHTPEVAIRKARTAAILHAPTAALETQIAEHPAYLAFPDRLPVAGGVPVLHEGKVAGAIGCSGGTPAEDEAICRAAVPV